MVDRFQQPVLSGYSPNKYETFAFCQYWTRQHFSRYISEGSTDMKFSPDVRNNKCNPHMQRNHQTWDVHKWCVVSVSALTFYTSSSALLVCHDFPLFHQLWAGRLTTLQDAHTPSVDRTQHQNGAKCLHLLRTRRTINAFKNTCIKC